MFFATLSARARTPQNNISSQSFATSGFWGHLVAEALMLVYASVPVGWLIQNLRPDSEAQLEPEALA